MEITDLSYIHRLLYQEYEKKTISCDFLIVGLGVTESGIIVEANNNKKNLFIEIY